MRSHFVLPLILLGTLVLWTHVPAPSGVAYAASPPSVQDTEVTYVIEDGEDDTWLWVFLFYALVALPFLSWMVKRYLRNPDNRYGIGGMPDAGVYLVLRPRFVVVLGLFVLAVLVDWEWEVVALLSYLALMTLWTVRFLIHMAVGAALSSFWDPAEQVVRAGLRRPGPLDLSREADYLSTRRHLDVPRSPLLKLMPFTMRARYLERRLKKLEKRDIARARYTKAQTKVMESLRDRAKR